MSSQLTCTSGRPAAVHFSSRSSPRTADVPVVKSSTSALIWTPLLRVMTIFMTRPGSAIASLRGLRGGLEILDLPRDLPGGPGQLLQAQAARLPVVQAGPQVDPDADVAARVEVDEQARVVTAHLHCARLHPVDAGVQVGLRVVAVHQGPSPSAACAAARRIAAASSRCCSGVAPASTPARPASCSASRDVSHSAARWPGPCALTQTSARSQAAPRWAARALTQA